MIIKTVGRSFRRKKKDTSPAYYPPGVPADGDVWRHRSSEQHGSNQNKFHIVDEYPSICNKFSGTTLSSYRSENQDKDEKSDKLSAKIAMNVKSSCFLVSRLHCHISLSLHILHGPVTSKVLECANKTRAAPCKTQAGTQ